MIINSARKRTLCEKRVNLVLKLYVLVAQFSQNPKLFRITGSVNVVR